MTSTATRRQLKSHYDVVEGLPEATVVTFHNVSWDGYEKLLAQVGEASGLRISYDEGEMQVMSLSTEHEGYSRFLDHLVSHLGYQLGIDIAFFGSATIKKRRRMAGKEPDGCFYVQNFQALGNRLKLDFAKDPPPDVAIEIDLSHDSRPKFPVYVRLGVPEIWRYDGYKLTIHLLHNGAYVESAASRALPLLTAELLSALLLRKQRESESQLLRALDEWLQAQSVGKR